MGKSARILGEAFGKSAREMNALLKEHGYLYGQPGAYGLTDKGKLHATEEHHTRGTGGYAHYNRSWETRTWDEGTADALRADMAGAEREDQGEPTQSNQEQHQDETGEPVEVDENSEVQLTGREQAIAAALGLAAVGAVAVAPFVKPFWKAKVQPVASKLRKRRRKQQAAEPELGTDGGAQTST